MKYEDAIFRSLEYIEKNIREDLNLELIANEVGYSEYHFSRIFKDQMGISTMEYVKERRLICASKEIFQGKKIIDVSNEYGYKTHSGFSKAFKKKFGFTPTDHLVYAINMLRYLNNDEGDNLEMINCSQNANTFLKSSVDFTLPEELYSQLFRSIKNKLSQKDLCMIEKAYNIAYKAHEGQYRKSGEKYITHPLCVSIILSEITSDRDIIIAGLLHDTIEECTYCTIEQIEKDFSKEIANLVYEVTNISKINWEMLSENEYNIESKVILIKLADRLHNMRTIKYMEPERYREKAKETIEIFSPIATRLKISKIKAELDDLALKYL